MSIKGTKTRTLAEHMAFARSKINKGNQAESARRVGKLYGGRLTPKKVEDYAYSLALDITVGLASDWISSADWCHKHYRIPYICYAYSVRNQYGFEHYPDRAFESLSELKKHLKKKYGGDK